MPKPRARKASNTARAMSGCGCREYGQSACVTRKSVWRVSNIENPSWCFVVKTMYFMPARRARSAQRPGSNRRGLNVRFRAK